MSNETGRVGVHGHLRELRANAIWLTPKVRKSTPRVSKREAKGTTREPKGSQSEPRNLQKHHLRNWIKNVRKRVVHQTKFWRHCYSKIDKKTIPKNIKNSIAQKHELYRKGSQNGVEINAETHQKSMPKLVANTIEKKH